MAVVYNPNDQDKNKDQQQQDQNQPASATPTVINAGNSSPITASSGNTQSNSSTQPQGSSSGRFTNIRNYITANQNFNQQGGGLAGKVVGNVQQQNQNFNQNVNQATQNFNQQANTNRRAYDANLVNNAITNPTQAVNDPQQMNQFAQMRDASYQGPTAIQEAPKLQVQAQNIQDTTQQLGNEAGRFNVLRQMFNKPTYSTGQQKLDNLLIQNNKDQINQIKNARVIGNTAQNTLNQANNQAQATGQLYTDEALRTKEATHNALNNAFSTQQTDLQKRVDEGKAYNQELANELANRTLKKDVADKLGLTAAETYGVDPTAYLRNIDPTLQNVANADDYTRYQALSKLAAQDPTLLVDPTKANTFNTFDRFDNDAYNDAVNIAKAAYDQKYNQYNGQLMHDTLDYNIKTQEAINRAYQALANQNNGGSESAPVSAPLVNDDGTPTAAGTAYQQKLAALQKYVKDVNAPVGAGWTAYNDFLWNNRDNAANWAPTMTDDQAVKLLGENNEVSNFIRNDGLVNAMNENRAKIAALQNLYGIGKGLKVEG